jgi:protein-tyrosine phosphatase
VIGGADRLPGLRGLWHSVATRVYGPRNGLNGLAFVPGARVAIGAMPVAGEILRLPDHGITHVVVCRAHPQTVFSQDRWAAGQVLGTDNVAHAEMWDTGRPKDPEQWSEAAIFAASALQADPEARVLVHCQQGRRRSVMVAYATLRLLGHSEADAARGVIEARPMGRLVPAYRASVERWLKSRADAQSAPPPGVQDPPALR